MFGSGETKLSRPLIVMALATTLAATGHGAALGQDATTEESPTDPGVLAGVELETVEVEPGVHHVLRDGVRDLDRSVEFAVFHGHMSPGDAFRINAVATRGLAANGNGVWLGGPDGVVRLGHEELVWEQEPTQNWYGSGYEVTPDDRLFRPDSGEIYNGDKWRRPVLRLKGVDAKRVRNSQFTSDGTLWTMASNDGQGRARRNILVRRDDDGWRRIKYPPDPPGRKKDARPANIGPWGVTDDGVVYVTRNGRQVQRYTDGAWETLPAPGGRIVGLHVGPEGTVWAERAETRGHTYGGGSEFVRLGEDGWTGYEVGAPRHMYPSPEAVAADGAMWVAPAGSLMSDGGCDGIIRIGDTGLDRFLPGHCVYDVAPGPGGEVWLEAGTWDGNWYAPDAVGPVGVYVITPAAWTNGE